MGYIIREDRIPYPTPINAVATVDLQQGQLVGIKGLKSGERELYNVGAWATGDSVGIVACSVLQYDERLTEKDFILKANTPGMVKIPAKGDQFTIAADLVHVSPLIGDKLEASTGLKFQKLASGTAIAIIRDIFTYEDQASVLIEFI